MLKTNIVFLGITNWRFKHPPYPHVQNTNHALRLGDQFTAAMTPMTLTSFHFLEIPRSTSRIMRTSTNLSLGKRPEEILTVISSHPSLRVSSQDTNLSIVEIITIETLTRLNAYHELPITDINKTHVLPDFSSMSLRGR